MRWRRALAAGAAGGGAVWAAAAGGDDVASLEAPGAAAMGPGQVLHAVMSLVRRSSELGDLVAASLGGDAELAGAAAPPAPAGGAGGLGPLLAQAGALAEPLKATTAIFTEAMNAAAQSGKVRGAAAAQNTMRDFLEVLGRARGGGGGGDEVSAKERRVASLGPLLRGEQAEGAEDGAAGGGGVGGGGDFGAVGAAAAVFGGSDAAADPAGSTALSALIGLLSGATAHAEVAPASLSTDELDALIRADEVLRSLAKARGKAAPPLPPGAAADLAPPPPPAGERRRLTSELEEELAAATAAAASGRASAREARRAAARARSLEKLRARPHANRSDGRAASADGRVGDEDDDGGFGVPPPNAQYRQMYEQPKGVQGWVAAARSVGAGADDAVQIAAMYTSY